MIDDLLKRHGASDDARRDQTDQINSAFNVGFKIGKDKCNNLGNAEYEVIPKPITDESKLLGK